MDAYSVQQVLWCVGLFVAFALGFLAGFRP